jgi:putative flippase GtrA
MMLSQVIRFGLVGCSACAVHFVVVISLVPLGMNPLIANIFGFMVAFAVSYFGHTLWTFNHGKSGRSLLKFGLVAVLSFIVNEGLFYLLLSFSLMPYEIALLLVLFLLALMTFMLSKFWAFSENTKLMAK